MRHCIWCSKTEGQNSFNKLAHTVPQSLGGKDVCCNVCDGCNSYFGSPHQGKPSIETCLKEALGISRFHILNTGSTVKRGSSVGRYKSMYFDIDFKSKKRSLKLKPAYSLRPHFQEMIGRQLKRALYKIFLEETERQRGDGQADHFNFIREFARYDLNDLPVLHFERRYGAMLVDKSEIEHPRFFMDKDDRPLYLIEDYGFFEFEILGHLFAVASSPLWSLTFNQFIKASMKAKEGLFNAYRTVKYYDDVDPTLSRVFQ